MDNNTFTAMGAMAFFDRYPVTDLMPVKDVVPPGRFSRLVSTVLRQPAPMPQVKNRLILGFKPQGHGGPATDDDLRVISSDRRIQYFDVCAPAGQGAFQSLTLAQCPANSKTPVCLKLRSRPQHTSIPVYYLPYDLNQHRRMTLVDKQHVGGVELFLTDIVDGCSVYVEGTAANPSVSHLNANKEHAVGNAALPPKTQPVALKADWKHKADHMNNRYQNAPQPKRVAQGANLEQARRVDYKHYGLRLAADETNFVNSLAALQLNGRVPNTVGGIAVAGLDIVHAAGCVFGVHALGTWSFHVQRRVLASLTDAGGTALAMQWIVRDVQQFWPAGGAVSGKAA